MGQITDILQQRGETDEALRIHIEERLPMAKKMGDLDSTAHIRLRCAEIRLSRGGMERGEAQVILDELSESFALSRKLQCADGIAFSGFMLGRALAMGGHPAEALQVLDVAAAAFEKLNRTDEVAQVRALQDQIRRDMNLE